MNLSPLLIHLHGFKCAGTTFAGILEKNFPSKVLYVESLLPNERLHFDRVKQLFDAKSFNAISSHLLAQPINTNHLVITFLRNPATRLISAYEFQKATNTLKPGDDNFRAFLNRLRSSSVANYQTRLLSKQSFLGTGQRKGWDLDPWSIDLNNPNLFVGTVELFNESLVLLEKWLQSHSVNFDASYKSAVNIGGNDIKNRNEINPDLIYPDMIEVDQLLWQRASNHLQQQITLDPAFNKKLEDFKMRSQKQADELVVIGPDSFIRL